MKNFNIQKEVLTASIALGLALRGSNETGGKTGFAHDFSGSKIADKSD